MRRCSLQTCLRPLTSNGRPFPVRNAPTGPVSPMLHRCFSEGNVWSRLLRWFSGDTETTPKSLWAQDPSIAKTQSQLTDIFNCGCSFGKPIPQPNSVLYEDWDKGSEPWALQLYGANLYWHMASTRGSSYSEEEPNLFDGKDVLEVGCTRGGGARYLAEVTRPRLYLATDVNQEHIDACIASTIHTPRPELSFEQLDATALDERFPPESFDVVLCVQAFAEVDQKRFLAGAVHVLRPGGRLLLCDALTFAELRTTRDDCEELGLILEGETDISRKVEAIGLCAIHRTREYWRFAFQKPDAVGNAS